LPCRLPLSSPLRRSPSLLSLLLSPVGPRPPSPTLFPYTTLFRSGLGVETVGTDAGAAAGFDPIFPCHDFFMGAGKYGLAQLQNLDQLPTTGAVILASPLKIVTGSGSPARVLALVER